MVTQRTEGLYRVFVLCQIVIVAILVALSMYILIRLFRFARQAFRRMLSV